MMKIFPPPVKEGGILIFNFYGSRGGAGLPDDISGGAPGLSVKLLSAGGKLSGPFTGGGLEEVIVGVVGTLQFDVFQYRMKNEYGVELILEHLPFDHLRRIASLPGDDHQNARKSKNARDNQTARNLILCTGSAVLEDFQGRLLIAFEGEWSVGFLTKHNPGLELISAISV